MYQEETYETNDDDAREAAQLADDEARFDYEAALQQQTLWAGTACLPFPPASMRYYKNAFTKEVA